jgi:hypothetical protein
LVEALGRGGHRDFYKLYKTGGAMAEAVEAARAYLEDHGVKVSEATFAALTAEMFGETGLAAAPDATGRAFATLAQPAR